MASVSSKDLSLDNIPMFSGDGICRSSSVKERLQGKILKKTVGDGGPRGSSMAGQASGDGCSYVG